MNEVDAFQLELPPKPGAGMANRWDELMHQFQQLLTEVANEHAVQVRSLQAEIRQHEQKSQSASVEQSTVTLASSSTSMASHVASQPSSPTSLTMPLPQLPSGMPPDLESGTPPAQEAMAADAGDPPAVTLKDQARMKSILITRLPAKTTALAPKTMGDIHEDAEALHNPPPLPIPGDFNMQSETKFADTAKHRQSQLRFQLGELVMPAAAHPVAAGAVVGTDPVAHAHVVNEEGWDPAAVAPSEAAERQAIEALALCSAPRDQTQERRRQTLQKYHGKDGRELKDLMLGKLDTAKLDKAQTQHNLEKSPRASGVTKRLSLGGLTGKRMSFSQMSKVPRASLTGLSRGSGISSKLGPDINGSASPRGKLQVDNGGARDSFSMLPLADRIGGSGQFSPLKFEPSFRGIDNFDDAGAGSAGLSDRGSIAGRLSCPYEDEYDEIDPEHRKIKCELKPCWVQRLAKDNENAVLKSSPSKLHLSCMTSTIEMPIEDPDSERGQWQKYIRPLVSHPSKPHRLAFDLMGMIFLGVDLVTIPLQAFGEHARLDSPGLVSLAFVSAIYWTLDMFCAFLVGYHTKGFVEMSPKRIILRYLRTWFFLDFTLVVVDWSFISLGFTQQASYMRVGKTMSRGMRALRLLRIVKMHTVFTELMEQIRSEYVRSICSIGSLVCFIVILNHFIACAWYALSFMTKDQNNWVEHYLHANHSLGYRYATSLHWSLTQFTPASMEVVPQNSLERVYSVCVLLFALITFSSFVSSITQAMSHLRNINIRKLEQQQVLRRYLNQHGISTTLVNRVWHYLHQRNVMNSGKVRTKERDVPMLDLLPGSMRVELRMEAFTPELHRHPFFLHYFQMDPQAARQICSHVLTELSLLARHELFSEGSSNIHMFFVVEGSLEYLLPCACAAIDNCNKQMQKECANGAALVNWDEEQEDYTNGAGVDPCDHLAVGEWACEVALWTTKIELSGPFVAMEKTEVLLVNATEFQQVISKNKGSSVQVAKYAQGFVEHLEKMTRCRWRIAMCNDFCPIQDLVHREFGVMSDDGRKKRHARSVGEEPALCHWKKNAVDPVGLALSHCNSEDEDALGSSRFASQRTSRNSNYSQSERGSEFYG